MKRSKALMRFMAFLLCAAMIITYMPTSTFTFADETSGEPVAAEEAPEPAPAPAPEKVSEPEPEPEPAAAPAEEPAAAEPAADSAEPAPDAEAADEVSEEPAEGGEPEALVVEDVAEPEEEAYPEFSCERNVSGMTVKIDAPEGALPEGVKVEVRPINSSEVSEVEDAVKAKMGEKTVVVKAVDITFFDKDGTEIEPKVPIKVQFISDAIDAAENASVLHINDNGKAEMADKGDVDGDTASFESKDFSVYVVAGDGTTVDEARATVIFKSGNSPIATVYVKNSDTVTELEDILYDPGAGEVPKGQTFLGWHVTKDPNPTYDSDTKPMNIEKVREHFAGLTLTEGETYYVHAMLFNVYHVSYKNEFGVVVRSDLVTYPATHEVGTLVDYSVDEPYTPEDPETTNFEGWNVESGGSNIESESSAPYLNSNIKIKGDVVFSVYAPTGNWMNFVENGDGASFTPPVFVKTGEKTVKPATDPNRLGYTFDGWYKEASCDNKYEFNETITKRLTLYAKWKPNEKANYTVIIWKQKVTGEGYDFEESIPVTDATVGQPASEVEAVNEPGNNDSYIKVDGTPKQYTGFHLQEYDTDVTVGPEGNTVVNVRYHRNTITLNFYTYSSSGGYTPVSGSYGDEGRYYTSQSQNSRRYVYYNAEDGKWYTNRRSSWSWDTWSWEYTFSGTSYNTVYTYSETTGWSLYKTLEGLYGSTFKEIGVEWPTDHDWYEFGHGTGGNKGTGGRYRQGDVSGTHTTFMDAFLIPNGADSENFYGTETKSGATIRFYTQNANKTGYDLAMTVNTSRGGSFNISDKFDGFTAYQYSADGGSWTSVGTKNPSTGYYGSAVSYDRSLNIRFNREAYDLTFMDGSYFDGHTLNRLEGISDKGLFKDVKGITYGASIASYAKGGDDYYDPTDDAPANKAFAFGGWYVDKSCNTPYEFTSMPRDGITVYAKWVKKEYRVFLHPHVDPSETDFEWGAGDNQETSFRVTWGEKISGGETINGTRPGYELIGWYYDDETFKQPFVFDAFVVNDDTVTATYDQSQPTELDKYGVKTSDVNKDKENDRFWVTRKLELYANWRFTLDGAKGINVLYDANGGSNAPTDPNFYLDKAKAVAQAASTAPETTPAQQFVCWVVQKWNENTGKFEPTSQKIFPGDEFIVNKTDAKVEELTPTQQDPSTKKYTVKLVAEYGPAEEPTPTHIWWYANDGQTTEPVKVNDGKTALEINEAVSIKAANTFTAPTGYEFAGWARYSTTETAPAGPDAPTVDDSHMFLKYENGKFYAKDDEGNFTVESTKIAADERKPYHDLYAVWCKLDKLEYKANGGTGNMDPDYGKTGDSVTVKENGFSRSGYTFKGWNTVASPTAENPGTPYSPGAQYELTAGEDILYAQWEASTANVTVEHYLKGQETAFKTDTIKDQPVGETYTAVPETKYQEKNLTVDRKDPESGSITVAATDNIIKIYYTMPLTIEAKTDSKTYDGNPLNGEYTISGQLAADTETIKTALGTAPSITNVRESPKTYQASTDGIPGYYVITNNAGTLTINPAKVTVKADDKTKVYDGKDGPELTATVTGLVGEDTIEYDLSREEGNDAGTYKITVGPKRAVNDNYEVSYVGGTLTITKAPVTITTGSGSKTYDGTALTNSQATITGLVNGETATVTATGSQTAVGSSKNTYSINWGDTNADNYAITPNLGDLTVSAATTPTPTPTPGGGGGGPAVTPAGPVTPAVVPDAPVPAAEPETIIPDEPTPMAEGTWALVNLISAIVTALGAIIALFRKKEDEDEDEDNMYKEEDEDDNRGKKMLAAKIAGALAGVAAPITFFLTEDMSLPMAMIDKWTVLMVAMLAVQIVAAVFNKKAAETEDDQETAEEAAN